MALNGKTLESVLSGSQHEDLHLDRKYQGKESILSSQINLYVAEAKPKIPDGGWGWCVVFAAFMLNVISEGVTLSFGFLNIKFLEEFKASVSATSWIGSLFMAIPLLAGPLASALVDKYGCKYMTVLGGFTCMIGFLLSAVANSIGVMYFTFGIIGGLSRSLTYVTAVVAIAFWFEKRQTVALGLQGSGAGIGTVIFPPINTYLLSEYGWRGTLVIFAGFFANMCVCGMLMRDPEWLTEGEEQEKKAKKQLKDSASLKTLKNAEEIKALLKDPYEIPKKNKDEKFNSVVNLPTFIKNNEKVPIEVLRQFSEKNECNYIVKNHPNLLTCKSTSQNGLFAFDDESRKQKQESTSRKETEKPLFPKIAEEDENAENFANSTVESMKTHQNENNNHFKTHPHAHNYLKNIRFKRRSLTGRGATANVEKFRVRASSCPNVYQDTVLVANGKDEKWYGEVWEILKNLSNFSLFLELHFLLQSLSTIILFTWFIVPYVYLPEHMTRIGFSEDQASFAVSVIGVTNTIGMVFLGIVGDRLNVAKVYAVCLILCGISVLSMMYFTANYTLLIINCALFGLFFASCFSLSPALMSTLVPLDGFTMAYGLGLLCEGIGNLIGPPLAGWLFDVTQSWEQSFYQAGGWIVVSGVLVGTIAFTKNRRILGTGSLINDKIVKDRDAV